MDHKTYKIFDVDDFHRLTRGIKVAQCMRTDTAPDSGVDSETVLSKLDDLSVSDKLFCSYCACSFDSQSQQRAHYKLDWHRYNLKQNLWDRKAVTEESFTQLADQDDVSSISGSECESDSSSDGRGKSVDRLLALRHTKVFFENLDGKIVSVHRCLLHGKKAALETDEELVATALKCVERTKWAIFMLGGGHFAAAIFHGGEVVQHKTFHSYTVRKGQGGTQSSRDNRSGSSHPKSAGASLRRYNEAALMQHVQDITSSWSDDLASCDLVFCRASGGNSAVLFGGRNPPFDRKDRRLRTIPFPTRRATFSEVKRVHDVLASVESYGMADAYRSTFPQSPRKKPVPKPVDLEPSPDAAVRSSDPDASPKVRSPRRRVDRAKSREPVERDLPSIVTELAADSTDSSGDEGDTSYMTHEEVTISFARDLLEHEDSVSQRAKNKRRKPRARKPKPKEETKPSTEKLSKRLMAACRTGDITALRSVVDAVKFSGVSSEFDCDAVAGVSMEGAENGMPESDDAMTEEDFSACLNRAIDTQGGTLLHHATVAGHVEVVRQLMELGANPSARNNKGQPSYAVATNKEMRNVFRRFLGEFPDKYDYTKSLIPGGLTDEMEQEQAEKRRALKKAKRDREKEKKKEDEVKKKEAEEKERFLKLSDREKRALAAERRMVSTTGPVATVLARCFLCAVDMSGKVPFEYNIHRFCSITCLKAHRMSHKTTL